MTPTGHWASRGGRAKEVAGKKSKKVAIKTKTQNMQYNVDMEEGLYQMQSGKKHESWRSVILTGALTFAVAVIAILVVIAMFGQNLTS
jgi:nitroimidazol reductase NimA-like FMN-containing flavoprotein (pyridoxamine 5'-phosphate oxidase superfamily)